MKTIAIVGAKGMLGIDMVAELKVRDLNVIEFDLSTLDITNVSDVQKLASLEIDALINCAAFTDVNGAEDRRDIAFKVNAYGPEYLAEVTRDLDIPVVHISTDYVFDGKNSQGYAEDNQEFGPLNVYGESKLEGEKRIQKINPKHYIVRTSWLFGEHGKNFVSTMVGLATQRDALTVVNDQYGNPTYTKDLAKTIVDMLVGSVEYGVYHVTNSTPNDSGITWYEFASFAIKSKGLKTVVSPVGSDAFPQKAERPEFSTLLNTKLPKLRDYSEAVLEYVQKLSV